MSSMRRLSCLVTILSCAEFVEPFWDGLRRGKARPGLV